MAIGVWGQYIYVNPARGVTSTNRDMENLAAFRAIAAARRIWRATKSSDEISHAPSSAPSDSFRSCRNAGHLQRPLTTWVRFSVSS